MLYRSITKCYSAEQNLGKEPNVGGQMVADHRWSRTLIDISSAHMKMGRPAWIPGTAACSKTDRGYACWRSFS